MAKVQADHGWSYALRTPTSGGVLWTQNRGSQVVLEMYLTTLAILAIPDPDQDRAGTFEVNSELARRIIWGLCVFL